MKRAIDVAVPVILLLGLLSSVFFVATPKRKLVQPAVQATLTSIAAAQPSQVTPTPTPASRVALLSFHGRYVTARGQGGGGLFWQEPTLSDCGWFTLHHLGDGKVALVTCHGQYVTAPQSGVTRADWLLWQAPELSPCGAFTLHNLGSSEFALETCVEGFLTAGDGNWSPGMEWAVVAETTHLQDWEHFTVLEEFTPLPYTIAAFSGCTGQTEQGGRIESMHDPSAGNTLDVSYVRGVGRGCIAKLEYDIVNWAALQIQLLGADLWPFSQLVFDIKADPQYDPPGQIKIEFKRAGGHEVSILYISDITTDWQTMRVNLSDLGPTEYTDPLSSFADMEELLFTFDEQSGEIRTVYLDNIALR